MTMQAFNQLLGLSTIDDRVHLAYGNDSWEEMLHDLEFSDDLIQAFRRIKAVTFEDFARAAYEVVVQAEAFGSGFPSPSLGLSCQSDLEGEKQVA